MEGTKNYTNYSNMSKQEPEQNDVEPETIDDLVALETVSVPCEEPVVESEGEDAATDETGPVELEMVDTTDETPQSLETEEKTEETDETPEGPVAVPCENSAEETTPLVFVPLVDPGLRLNIRKAPDGPVIAKVTEHTRLTCIEDGKLWAWVEFEVDGEKVRGYAKKEFLVNPYA